MTSPLWTSDELRDATGGTLTAELAVTGISIDTRTLQKGDLFIALKGDRSDGHAHIETALNAGAACVMVHDRMGRTDPRLLVVQDTLDGMVALGKAARARFDGKVIAITGSVGKTTTKEMLRTALSAIGKTHAAVASFNNHWGVPLTLARLPRDAAFCISEIGMNHEGEIRPLADQVRPHVAIVTTVGSSHLGNMGSIAAIAREKASLFSALLPGGTAIIPDDCPGQDVLRSAVPDSSQLWRSGVSRSADIKLENLICKASGSTFLLETPQAAPLPVQLTAPGRHMARNAAIALGAVTALSVERTPAAQALTDFVPGEGRGARRTILDGVTLLDESYNASSTSMRATLETLSLLPAKRHVVALGDILELGIFAEDEHRTLAEAVIAAKAIAFCCGPHMRALYDALPPELQGNYAPDSRQLAPLLRAYLKPGDFLLVKGSNGSRMRDLVTFLDHA
ncbi:UDP-N-acetylmuramoyl-tripeptide--D-alanyl-D-alanine ligase [Neokomagataea anthophila]|uniref:UDP-N-acetylmuramoyl-tripeptide--D-alanyl-D-alanine ligase n=1 Tax=Neokomagataea anthophila TaxID=2826925 RepID=A0ABS5E5E0_9PROT|nr:UDP-N-acetylmuramoyl-tripeptide--D-alanyl-D-alanine ligase [Neokomagataea anthophila]MBR0559104.1 UDP-N-acetylmuramoyl-tripeptide--D-alanyl-D-alanine ligase [Neokomagataea anthophila]